MSDVSVPEFETVSPVNTILPMEAVTEIVAFAPILTRPGAEKVIVSPEAVPVPKVSSVVWGSIVIDPLVEVRVRPAPPDSIRPPEFAPVSLMPMLPMANTVAEPGPATLVTLLAPMLVAFASTSVLSLTVRVPVSALRVTLRDANSSPKFDVPRERFP
jgi:hypothetical protein